RPHLRASSQPGRSMTIMQSLETLRVTGAGLIQSPGRLARRGHARAPASTALRRRAAHHTSQEERPMPLQRITVGGLARLPAFCHAVVADGWIHVSGTLGTAPGSMELVPGGTGPQTTQALRNIEQILRACG